MWARGSLCGGAPAQQWQCELAGHLGSWHNQACMVSFTGCCCLLLLSSPALHTTTSPTTLLLFAFVLHCLAVVAAVHDMLHVCTIGRGLSFPVLVFSAFVQRLFSIIILHPLAASQWLRCCAWAGGGAEHWHNLFVSMVTSPISSADSCSVRLGALASW